MYDKRQTKADIMGSFDRVLAENERLRVTLKAAKEKLNLYRAQHSGEYIGGMEYTALIREIDECLR